MKRIIIRGAIFFGALHLSACSFLPYGAYTNQVDPQAVNTINQTNSPASPQASIHIRPSREAKACKRAGIEANDPKRQRDVLVLLALSGGGSRAAYFSALSMLEMQRLGLTIGNNASDVLHEIDAMSSVSGGSLAAAYYAVSYDPGQNCAAPSDHVWDENTVREVMTKDYLDRWIGNWFWPSNIFKFWFTRYDRTDIMAQTLADNLFNKSKVGSDLSFAELNPLRPNLIVNATIGSNSFSGRNDSFGSVFTFTNEDFSRICSDLPSYSVSRGVMASATFPGAFNFMTLCDYCWKKDQFKTQTCSQRDDPRYLHVFDGGNADNLGLTSIKRVLWDSLKMENGVPHLPYKKVIVILVDSFINSVGVDPRRSDARAAYDFVIDTNFIDATDSLLQANRQSLLNQFETGNIFPYGEDRQEAGDLCRRLLPEKDVDFCNKENGWWDAINKEFRDKRLFVHLQFNKIGDVQSAVPEQVVDNRYLMDRLLKIPTNFKFDGKSKPASPQRASTLQDQEVIACGVPLLFGREDYTFCGDHRPVKSKYSAVWDRVKCVLENPDSDCSSISLAAKNDHKN